MNKLQEKAIRLYTCTHLAKNEGRRRTNRAIKDGDLVRQPCEICGAEQSHAHHEDYRKPYDIQWRCAKHHHERHGELWGSLQDLSREEADDFRETLTRLGLKSVLDSFNWMRAKAIAMGELAEEEDELAVKIYGR